MSILEVIATAMGILSVWYARKNNVLVFPTGIISVLIYVYITYEYKIYAEAGINIYYFLMSVYGWILWTSKNKKIKKRISENNLRDNIIYISFFLISFLILFFILQTTDSDSDVLLDSITTSLSLTAMLLLARRKIENWIYWIIADISIFLYLFTKNYMLLAFNILFF